MAAFSRFSAVRLGYLGHALVENRNGLIAAAMANLIRLPRLAARYYIHVTETHVAAGFGKFVEYQTRNVAEGLGAAFPQASEAVQ
ncbi:MAG: hypothetical protein WBM14_13840 [Terracidiphilus sp.]